MSLSPTTSILRCATLIALVAPLAGLVWGLARLAPLQRPTTGVRGEMRRRALSSSLLLRIGEPILLVAGGWFLALDGAATERRSLVRRYFRWQEDQLTVTGRIWGLDAYELTASILVCAVACSSAVGAATLGYTRGGTWVVPAAVLGAAIPNLRLQTVAAERFKAAVRHLPAVTDLAALCMSGGADFTQTLRHVVEGGRDPITEELGRVLHALEVGHTRKAALLEFAQRLPVEPVRDLVRALVQAEERGNSLGEALRNQARTSRQRRSVVAEEAAARAGVLMIVPLMLLFGCVVLLLLGPFIVNGGGL